MVRARNKEETLNPPTRKSGSVGVNVGASWPLRLEYLCKIDGLMHLRSLHWFQSLSITYFSLPLLSKNLTMTWTEKDFSNLQTAERVASILSLVGCFFIVVTFCSSSAFHTPISRLIFYASFGNILSNVATLISRQGILAGQNSVLCQLQAFFIQQ